MNTCRSSLNAPLASRQPCWACSEPTRKHWQRPSVTGLERRHVHRSIAFHLKKSPLQHSAFGHFCAVQAKTSQFVGPQPGAKRWRSQTVHAVAGNSSTTAPMQATRKFSPTKCGLRRPVRSHQATFGAAWPNHSLNLRANGMPQSPRHSAGMHYLWRGLCVTPLSPG